jgi:oligoribonuclease NrnB/cAMP/cGMP phosphodiesterase (DHH superfamily)
MTLHILHHNDADGLLAAAIVAKAMKSPASIRFIKGNYGAIPELFLVEKNDQVVIVDYSLQDEAFAALRATGCQITWIDHHASCRDSKHLDLPGMRDFRQKGPAACELTWAFYFKDRDVPLAVRLVGDYDSWRHALAPDCLAFNEATKMEGMLNRSPADWIPLLSPEAFAAVRRMIADGHVAIRYRDATLTALRKSYGRKVVLRHEDWPALGAPGGSTQAFALNVALVGSQAFAEKMTEFPVCLAYIHNGERVQVSIYSEKPYVDCGALAKAFGGGGHRGAAGFWCDKLPWTVAQEGKAGDGLSRGSV